VLAGNRGHYHLTREVQKVQVPATVQAVLAARIDRLPIEAQAAAGRRPQSSAKDVSLALLQEIADLSEGGDAPQPLACSRLAEFPLRDQPLPRAWSTRSATR